MQIRTNVATGTAAGQQQPERTTIVPIPQGEISRAAMNVGIVTGAFVAVIMYLILRAMSERSQRSLPWWGRLIVVAIVAWIVNIILFRMFYPVIAGTFDNTVSIFEGTGVISAVAVYFLLDRWGSRKMGRIPARSGDWDEDGRRFELFGGRKPRANDWDADGRTNELLDNDA